MTINYLAVFICAIVSMIVGFIWYGPLFGKVWMQIMGADIMTPEQKQTMRKNMWVMYFIQLVLSIVTVYVLSYFISNVVSDISSVGITVLVWFGFTMPTMASGALWSGKTKKIIWRMFLISAGAQLVSFIIFGLILSSWQ